MLPGSSETPEFTRFKQDPTFSRVMPSGHLAHPICIFPLPPQPLVYLSESASSRKSPLCFFSGVVDFDSPVNFPVKKTPPFCFFFAFCGTVRLPPLSFVRLALSSKLLLPAVSFSDRATEFQPEVWPQPYTFFYGLFSPPRPVLLSITLFERGSRLETNYITVRCPFQPLDLTKKFSPPP